MRRRLRKSEICWSAVRRRKGGSLERESPGSLGAKYTEISVENRAFISKVVEKLQFYPWIMPRLQRNPGNVSSVYGMNKGLSF